MLNGDFTNTAFQIGFQPGDSAILSIENVDPTGLGEYLVDTDQLKKFIINVFSSELSISSK